jgi:hypothetical protein
MEALNSRVGKTGWNQSGYPIFFKHSCFWQKAIVTLVLDRGTATYDGGHGV